MTALILHKDGRRLKEPNVLQEQGSEGRGLWSQPEEEVHAELHETMGSPYQGTNTELLCHIITSLCPNSSIPHNQLLTQARPPQWRRGTPSCKGSEVGAGLSSPPTTFIKNNFDCYDLTPGLPFTFLCSPQISSKRFWAVAPAIVIPKHNELVNWIYW